MSDHYTWSVARNEEGQYSIVRGDLPVPAGWATVTQAGSREAALDYIEREWDDIRPWSAR